MSHWHEAGFGTDPDGDAARVAELHRAAILTPRVSDEELPAVVEVLAPVDGELVPVERPAEDGVDPHAVLRIEYPWGVAWTCACGRWEAVATGPSSAAWAGADHARHVRDEEAGSRGD